MRTRKHFLATLLVILAFILPALTVRAQVTPTTLTSAFTSAPTVVTNGVTTFAGSTNVTIDVYQGKGVAFTFSALATNAGQLTFYLSPSVDGTNFVDTTGCWIYGNTLNASGWITRGTNIPASVTDNYRKLKVLIASNSAAYLVISNSQFSRR